MEFQMVFIMAVLFVAALTASTFGFGAGLLTMPLLAFMVDIRTAVALSLLVSITVVVCVLLGHWRKAQLRSVGYLMVSSCVGVPFGFWGLHRFSESALKLCLAFIVVAFSVYSLSTTRQMRLKSDRTAGLFGFVSGILGAAYTIPGPPVIVYGILRRWPPEAFRVTLLLYFLPNFALVMIGYYLSGFMTLHVMQVYAYALPAVLAAIVIGNRANRSIPKEKFAWFVHALLILIGILLATQVIKTI